MNMQTKCTVHIVVIMIAMHLPVAQREEKDKQVKSAFVV